MPIDLNKYPTGWKQIARRVKDAAGWTCQECGRPCRKPGVIWQDFVGWLLSEFEESWYWETCDEICNDETGEHFYADRPQRFTLTVAHLDHNPQNSDPSNLKALCSGCHLRYDAKHHAANASATRYRKRERKGQLTLFNPHH